MTRIRVAIVEDHPMVRVGVKAVIHQEPDLDIVWSGPSLTGLPPDLGVDVIILDLDLNGTHPDPAEVAHFATSGVGVLVYSALGSDAAMRDVLRAGATGVVGKNEDIRTLLEAVRTVAKGGGWMNRDLALAMLSETDDGLSLSAREREVLRLYSCGLTIAAVAERLGLSSHTVVSYLRNIRRKFAALGTPATSQLDLHRLAVRHGLIDS